MINQTPLTITKQNALYHPSRIKRCTITFFPFIFFKSLMTRSGSLRRLWTLIHARIKRMKCKNLS